MPNDLRFARALRAAAEAAPLWLPQADLVPVVRAALAAADQYIDDNAAPTVVEDTSIPGLPLCYEKAITAIDAGDRVWSWDTGLFLRVTGAGRSGTTKTVLYAGGDTAKFDLRQVDVVLVADNRDAADAWNAAQAEATAA